MTSPRDSWAATRTTRNNATGTMKIAHIIRSLEVGGAEHVTVELANLFAGQGEDVTIFAAWPTSNGSSLRDRLGPSVHVEYVGCRKRSLIGTYATALSWAWRNRRRLLSYDVLHCHLTYGAFLGTILHFCYAGRRERPRIVETYHSVGAPMSSFVRWAHSYMATRRDVFVLMASDSYWNRFTAKHKNLLVKMILNGARTPDVQGVDATTRCRYRAELRVPQQARFVVGSVGMLRRDRHPWAFIPVIQELVREFGSELHWIFAGDGPERENLERLVRNAGLAANVHFTGLVNDIRYPLSLFDLHFTITVRDFGGVGAIEAALAGVPAVGLQAAADHQSADDWIWSSVDCTALAAMAIRLLRNPAERKAIAERQQQYARTHHSVERMGEAYRRVYVEPASVLGTTAR